MITYGHPRPYLTPAKISYIDPYCRSLLLNALSR